MGFYGASYFVLNLVYVVLHAVISCDALLNIIEAWLIGVLQLGRMGQG